MKAEESSTGHYVHGNPAEQWVKYKPAIHQFDEVPEPVHDVGSVGLRDDLTAEVGDGWEVHADGDLQEEEGEEGDDGVCW